MLGFLHNYLIEVLEGAPYIIGLGSNLFLVVLVLSNFVTFEK